jgi:hypothetical protein
MKTFPIPSKPAPSGGESDTKKDEDNDTNSYARGGYVKGGDVRVGSYAAGGPVLGRARSFMKEPDPFTVGMAVGDSKFTKTEAKPGSPQEYTKSGPGEKGRDKSLKTVMPRQ